MLTFRLQIGIEPVEHDKRYEISDEYLRVLYKYVHHNHR